MSSASQVTPAPAACNSPTLTYSSDFSVRSLTIVTSGGDMLDIRHNAIEINLYENIFSPVMSGSIFMGDALDIVGNFQLHGNEYLLLELDKPSLNKPITKIFRIYKISDRNLNDPTTTNYTIHFTSEEAILNVQKFLSKSYRGMLISDMIKDILLNQLGTNPKKINFFETTQGSFNIIVPRMYPLNAIEWLSTRAYSSSASLHFFWENRDGYNFRSIESIMKDPIYTTYYRKPKTDTKAVHTINSINLLTVLQDFDLLKSIQYGAYNSTLVTFDLINQNFLASTIPYGSLPTLNPAMSVNNSVNRFNRSLTQHPDAFMKFYPSTDGDPFNNAAHPANWLHKKESKLAQLEQFKMIAAVPGDITISTGRTVNVEIPAMQPQGSSPATNPQRTGKYLISAIHHTFRVDQMVTIMELLSDSVSKGLSPPNNSSSGMLAIKEA